jgi:hypothetical protein
MHVRNEARWILVLTFACSALLVGEDARDILHKQKTDARCLFVVPRSKGPTNGLSVDSNIRWSSREPSDRLSMYPIPTSGWNSFRTKYSSADKSAVTATIMEACLPEDEPQLKVGDKWLFYIRPKPYAHEITHHVSTRGLRYRVEPEQASEPSQR